MDASTLVALIAGVPVVGPYAVWLPVVVLACSAIDAALPQPATGSVWVWPRRVIGWLAVNIRNAKNAIPAGAPRLATDLAAVAEVVVADARAVPADPLPAAS